MLTQKGLITRFVSPEVNFATNYSDVRLQLHISFKQGKINRMLSDDSKHLSALRRLSRNISKKFISYSPNQASSLDDIIHHFSSLKYFVLHINEEMVKNRKNFEILTQFVTLRLMLLGDEKMLLNTPALDLFNNLPNTIRMNNPKFANISNIETFIERVKEVRTLFPNHLPLELTMANDKLKAQFTDELLLQMKCEKNLTRRRLSVARMSQITLVGLLQYLEGLQFEKLIITGCTKVISEGGLQELQKRYPDVRISA